MKMSNVRIPIKDKDMIDNNWPGSIGYTETETCTDITENFEKWFYQLYPDTPVIGYDIIDGNYFGSMGYTETTTCDKIRADIASTKKAYGWD